MKKIAIAMMLGVAALSANAQVNYRMQTACNPQDVKTYDTQRLRSSFMMEKVLVDDEINVTYSMYDRFIFGGAMPVKELSLDTIDPLKAPYFLFNRELGVINIGGDGIVTVDSKEYELKFKEALYVGRGNQKVTFKSKDASKPAKFYINSAIAHKEYKTQWITIDGRKGSLKANSMAAGKMEEKQRPCHQPADCKERTAGRSLPITDGTDRAETGKRVEHHACSHSQPSYRSLFLLQRARRQHDLPPDGRTAGRTSGMACQRTGYHVTRMVYPRCSRN